MDDITGDRAPASGVARTRVEDVLALGPPVSEQHSFSHDKDQHGNVDAGNVNGGVGYQGSPSGVESPSSVSFSQGTTTYPPTAFSSDYSSRFSKPDTEVVTPTVQHHGEERSQLPVEKDGHAYHHPVRSFSSPPWALTSPSDTSSPQTRWDERSGNAARNEESGRLGFSSNQDNGTYRTGEYVTSSSPVAESPFTDDAAIRQPPIGPRLVLPPGMAATQEPRTSSPTAEYFPSMLKVQTNVDGAAGPISAASDPYTMHRTQGNDPIYQHTVPNTPRQLHPRSLAAHLAQHPNDTARRAVRKTYPKPNPLFRFFRRFKVRHDVIKGCSEQEMMKFEKKEGKKRRRLAGWRLAEENSEEDRFAEDGVERPVVSELFWKVSSCFPWCHRVC
jgi:hypothetical protein